MMLTSRSSLQGSKLHLTVNMLYGHFTQGIGSQVLISNLSVSRNINNQTLLTCFIHRSNMLCQSNQAFRPEFQTFETGKTCTRSGSQGICSRQHLLKQVREPRLNEAKDLSKIITTKYLSQDLNPWTFNSRILEVSPNDGSYQVSGRDQREVRLNMRQSVKEAGEK